jgi:hypothetical protein
MAENAISAGSDPVGDPDALTVPGGAAAMPPPVADPNVTPSGADSGPAADPASGKDPNPAPGEDPDPALGKDQDPAAGKNPDDPYIRATSVTPVLLGHTPGDPSGTSDREDPGGTPGGVDAGTPPDQGGTGIPPDQGGTGIPPDQGGTGSGGWLEPGQEGSSLFTDDSAGQDAPGDFVMPFDVAVGLTGGDPNNEADATDAGEVGLTPAGLGEAASLGGLGGDLAGTAIQDQSADSTAPGSGVTDPADVGDTGDGSGTASDGSADQPASSADETVPDEPGDGSEPSYVGFDEDNSDDSPAYSVSLSTSVSLVSGGATYDDGSNDEPGGGKYDGGDGGGSDAGGGFPDDGGGGYPDDGGGYSPDDGGGYSPDDGEGYAPDDSGGDGYEAPVEAPAEPPPVEAGGGGDDG